jgi:tRNA A37 threonylcarbamoyladenosine modification protein TsaB
MICIRARKEEVYAALYESSDPLAGVLVDPGIYRAEALAGRIGEDFAGVLAAGSGRTELTAAPVRWLPASLDSPRPSAVAVLASKEAAAGGFDRVLEPRYLRDWNQEARGI